MSLMLRVTQKPIKRKPSPSGSEGFNLADDTVGNRKFEVMKVTIMRHMNFWQ